MHILETFTMAIKSVTSNKLRSFLTMLGIIIGVGAVTVIVGLGNGISNYMSDSFASLGTNTLTVSINGRSASRSISEEQMYEIAEENSSYFSGITPTVSMRGTIKLGTETLSSSTTGVSEEYLDLKDLTLYSGRWLSYIDVTHRKKVCVIGAYTNQEYFSNNGVGQTIRIGSNVYSIVGVLDQIEDSMDEGGTDDCIYIPYTTAARLSSSNINSYTFFLVDENYASDAKEKLEDILYEIFQSDSAYTVVSMASMLDTLTSMVNVVITVLAIIAGISLLVGGVGIMNIMLVSVTERTKEIGIRKALGAKERIIRLQFVTEAAVLSGMGGVIGIALGYLISSVGSTVIVSILEENVTIAPSINSALIAFSISVGIGILFGYLPASKASRLNPIDALRFE